MSSGPKDHVGTCMCVSCDTARLLGVDDVARLPDLRPRPVASISLWQLVLSWPRVIFVRTLFFLVGLGLLPLTVLLSLLTGSRSSSRRARHRSRSGGWGSSRLVGFGVWFLAPLLAYLIFMAVDWLHVPSGYEEAVPGSGVYSDVTLERAIIAETNRVRLEHGAGELRVSSSLDAAARGHSVNMARTGEFAHEVDGPEDTLGSRVDAAGYPQQCGASENIAWRSDDLGFGSEAKARALVDQWMGSPGHQRNLLDRRMVKIGVGVAIQRGGGLFATQNFGDC